jgi:prophage regulatory protein
MTTLRSERSPNPPSDDALARLTLDAGTRTLGELIQERQLAISEILRLRALISGGAATNPTSMIFSVSSSALLPQVNEGGLLTIREVCTLLSLSRSTVYTHVKAGKFPPPLKVSVRAVRWRRIDVVRWQSTLNVRGDHV